jgi:transposase
VELARRVVVEELALSAAAAADRVSRQTAAKWVRRFREHGLEGQKPIDECVDHAAYMVGGHKVV